MNKTLLVAQREFVENLRTKTFWLGILALPVLLVVAIFVGKLLEENKDIRTYAVLDKSEDQWLSKRVAEKVQNSDFREVSDALQEQDEEAIEDLERKFEKLIAAQPEGHPIRELLEDLQALDVEVDPAKIGSPADLPKEARDILGKWMMEVIRDPSKRDALAQFASSISLSDYRYVEFDDLGDDPEKALKQKLEDEEIFAYFIIGEDPIATDEGSSYVSNNLTDGDLRQWYERQATSIVRKERIVNLQLSQEDANSILRDFDFSSKKVSEETGEVEDVKKEDAASSFAPVGFVYLLWIAIITATQMLLTNTVEEKSNRLIEVLLSSVSPIQLMAGKVIGIGATGMTLVVAWVVSALVGIRFLPEGGAIAEIGLAGILGDPLYLASFVGYFLAGYLLYAAFLVAIGSVCNSLKEAQSLQQPVFILLIVPLLAMVPVVQDPNGTVAVLLTYIPFFTPFLMMNRAGGPPPGWEYALSSVVMVISIAIAFWGAAKVFRLGILMTGKPPRLMEILRWLRAPVGQIVDRSKTE